MKEIYFVTDVETTGSVPGFCSMLTLGCVVVPQRGHQLAAGRFEFYERLAYDFKEDGFDQPTLDWWEKTRKEPNGEEAYQEAFRRERNNPRGVMHRFIDFVHEVQLANRNEDGSIPKAVFVSRPGSFDRAFIEHYRENWTFPRRQSPFEKHTLDIKSLIFGVDVGIEAFSDIDSKEFDREIGLDPAAHTHIAIDDARHLAAVLNAILTARATVEMMAENVVEEAKSDLAKDFETIDKIIAQGEAEDAATELTEAEQANAAEAEKQEAKDDIQ